MLDRELMAVPKNLFGRASAYVETISYSTSFFFHFVPGIAESSSSASV